MRASGASDSQTPQSRASVPALFGARGLPPWVWKVALAGQLLLAAGYFLLPAARVPLWALLGYTAAALTVLGVTVNRPNAPAGWYLMAGAQAMFITGDTLYYVASGFDRAGAAPSAVVLLCYAAEYTLEISGLTLLIRARSNGRDGAGMLDALIVATGIGVLVWSLVVRPAMAELALSPGIAVATIAFPIADLAILTLFIRLWTMGGRFGPAFWLLGASHLGVFSADLLFSALALEGSWTSGTVVDFGWVAYLVGLSSAALHPSMRTMTEPVSRRGPRLSRWRLALLATASLITPGVMVVQWLRGVGANLPVMAASAATLFLLTIMRIAGLARRMALQHERREMLQMLLRATEAERLRMAGDLHDGPVQALTALAYTTHRARRQLSRGENERAESLLAELERGLEDETAVLRRLMTELRPPVWHDAGLAEALRERANSLETATKLLTRVDIQLTEKLPHEVEMVLFRVAQECMTNVGKHAQAKRVAVSIVRRGGLVELTVTDDGVGFENVDTRELAAQGHFGLVSMQERVTWAGGRLTIVTAPGQGTQVRASLPLEPPTPPAETPTPEGGGAAAADRAPRRTR